MACLTPSGVEKLRTMLTTDGSKLSQLAQMETKERKAKIAEFLGSDIAETVNYEIEKRLVSKTTDALRNWAEKEVSDIKTKSDILKRVSKLETSIKNFKELELLNKTDNRARMIEDLIAHKLGVAVTTEEAGVAMDLAISANEGRKKLTPLANATTAYGKAFNDIQKGKSKEQALEENKISVAEYDSISEERAKTGADIIRYVDYMDKIKQQTYRLKKEDWIANWWEASKKAVGGSFDSLRAVLASGDMGFIVRQGGKAATYNPRVWAINSAEALVNAKKAFGNEDFKTAIMADIFTRPNMLSGHYDQSGLAVHTLEDFFQNSLIETMINPKEGQKANVFQEIGQRYSKFSQDNYLAYLYKLRADLFDAHFDALEKSGASYESIGEFFNNLTGRGTGAIGGTKSARGFGAYFMFAPKYVQSQINSITSMANPSISPQMRIEYAKNLAVNIATITALLMIAMALGGEIEDDPRSASFGKIKLPSGYIVDISGGMIGYINLVSRIITNETKTQKGKVKELGTYGMPKPTDLIFNFLKNKGSPQVSLISSVLDRQMFGGDALTFQNVLENSAPIIGQDAFDKFSDEDIDTAEKFALSMLSMFGVSSYNPENFREKRAVKG